MLGNVKCSCIFAFVITLTHTQKILIMKTAITSLSRTIDSRVVIDTDSGPVKFISVTEECESNGVPFTEKTWIKYDNRLMTKWNHQTYYYTSEKSYLAAINRLVFKK